MDFDKWDYVGKLDQPSMHTVEILDDNLKFIKIKFINIFLINHMVVDIKMFN